MDSHRPLGPSPSISIHILVNDESRPPLVHQVMGPGRTRRPEQEGHSPPRIGAPPGPGPPLLRCPLIFLMPAGLSCASSPRPDDAARGVHTGR
jgi:hypothetical protein